MALVYLADDLKSGGVVALKVLNADQQNKPRSVERFKREGRLICKLHHPNLVRGIESGVSSGRHYIAMEYVDGPSIRELIRKRGHLPADEATKLILEVTLALNHLFVQGAIQAHRDIKPGNILVTTAGTAKLTDFGIAKAMSEHELLLERTKTDSMLGSLNYMPPEQIENPGSADIRSDLYALGAVFYEMLTGEKAFPGKNPRDMIEAHYSLGAPSVKGDSDLIACCNEILAMTLAREVSNRYQTPREMLQRLATMSDSDVSVSIPRFSRQSVILGWSIGVLVVAMAIMVSAFVSNASSAYEPAAADVPTEQSLVATEAPEVAATATVPGSISGQKSKRSPGERVTGNGASGANSNITIKDVTGN